LVAAASLSVTAKIASELYQNGKEGIKTVQFKKSVPSLNRIAVTETYHAFNEQYIHNHSELEGFYEWIAVLDARVCDQCEDLDGNKYTYEELPEEPPLHPLCRCSLIFFRK
jgi:SPP1 gp7 family putative phage head morphogenesis protein